MPGGGSDRGRGSECRRAGRIRPGERAFEPFPLIFDTGASVSVFDKDFADELALEVVGQTRIGDPTNPEALSVDQIAIPELSIGEAFFSDMQGVAWDRPEEMRRKLTRGILGLPTFSQCLFTIDYESNELRIEGGELPPANGRDIIAIDSSSGVVTFTVEIDGQSYDAVLDSGNPGHTLMPQVLMEKMDLVEGTTFKGKGRMVNSSIDLTMASITNDLHTGAYTLRNPAVSFGSNMKWINFGRTFLKQAAVTLDLANGRMRVRPNGSATDAKSAGR